MVSAKSAVAVRSARGAPWRRFWCAVGLALVAACERDNLKPEALVEPERLYWNLELNQHAVTLSTTAPYDTTRLAAVARNHRGELLGGLPAPQYISTDIEHVLVSPEGLLVAVAPNDNYHLTKVIATMTVDNLKHSDSVWVRVVDNPAPSVLASLSIHPIPPESAKVARVGRGSLGDMGACGKLPVRAVDATGTSLLDLPVFVASSDTTIATVDQDALLTRNPDLTCIVRGEQPGTVALYAAMTAFGVTKADTLEYRIGMPITGAVHIMPAGEGSSTNVFVEPALRVGVGAMVVWSSGGTDVSTDVVFTDPTNVIAVSASPWAYAFDQPGLPTGLWLLQCQLIQLDCTSGGNFEVAPRKAFGAIRVLSAPGIYEYHTSGGASAKIIAVDER